MCYNEWRDQLTLQFIYLRSLIFIVNWLELGSPNRYTSGHVFESFQRSSTGEGNAPQMWVVPSLWVGSSIEEKQNKIKRKLSIWVLCSEEVKRQKELLLQSCLPHCNGWHPQTMSLSTLFLPEGVSCPLQVIVPRKVTNTVLCGPRAGLFCRKLSEINVTDIFLVLQNLVTGGWCPQFTLEDRSSWSHRSHTFHWILFVLRRASPFSAASLLFPFEAVWSSLIYPADTCWRREGWWEETDWAVPFPTKFWSPIFSCQIHLQCLEPVSLCA